MKFDAGFRFVYMSAHLKMARKRFTIARKPCFNVHSSNSCSLVSKQYACLVFSNHRLVSYHGRMCKISNIDSNYHAKIQSVRRFFFRFLLEVVRKSNDGNRVEDRKRNTQQNPWNRGHFYGFKEITKFSNVLLTCS